jgi:outer membrane protein assembly factor BamB
MGKPVPDGNRIYVSAGNNQVFAFDKQTGAWGWQYSGGEDADLTIRGAAGISVVDSAIYTAFSNGTVVKLDKAKGIALWSQKFSSGTKYDDIDSTPVVWGGRVCVVVYGSRLVCLKTEDGATLWSAAVQAHQAPETDGETLYLGVLDGAVKAFEATTGAVRWATQVGSAAVNSPRLVGNSIFVSDEEGRLTELDAKTGQVLWHYDGAISGTFAPVVWDGESVYLFSNMGNLFRFSVGNPTP